jgi:hypothetical protein
VPRGLLRGGPSSRGDRLSLDPKTQLLYSGARFFMNGEALAVPPGARSALRELADRRSIPASRLAALRRLIGEWQRAGYLHRSTKHDG